MPAPLQSSVSSSSSTPRLAKTKTKSSSLDLFLKKRISTINTSPASLQQISAKTTNVKTNTTTTIQSSTLDTQSNYQEFKMEIVNQVSLKSILVVFFYLFIFWGKFEYVFMCVGY